MRTELARVLAHCGGDLEAAVRELVGAIAAAPGDSEPYAVLAELWRDRRRELAELTRDAELLRTVLALSYVNFLRGDMDGAALAIGPWWGLGPTSRGPTRPGSATNGSWGR
ncbi:hypothetical protein ABZX85_46460 [Streptomyces sp. NPDC004539]|uniref:hypothetical protein n=1 Tax=Streptomyces sp. NPDC004539 TaxID=3154280 RepID=UPI0033B251EC